MSEGNAKLVAGQFDGTEVVEIAPGLNLTKLPLSPEEAYLLSRANAPSKISELLASSGLPESQARKIVASLLQKGCLVAREDPALREQVDLPEERKREILALERKLETANAFELLGLSPGTSAADCKDAYYDLSMRLHPDRYYGKELGSFRGRIDKIFKRLTDAQLTLTDPERRQAYEKAHPELFRRAAEPAPVHDAVRAEDRARRIARHPYLAKAMRRSEQLTRARRSVDEGKLRQALNDVNLLLGHEPNNEEAKALLAQITQRLGVEKAGELVVVAKSLTSIGALDKALANYLEALRYLPQASTCEKAAELAVRIGDQKAATQVSAQWVELDPKSSRARLALARALAAAGMVKNAKREAEEALRLDPASKQAKSLLSKLL